jgi:structure-specific recognition protein 1
MSDRKNLDFDSIHSGLDSAVGRFRLAPNGIGWKGSDETTKIIAATEIKKFAWLRVARGHELRITLKDGTTSKFDGFKKEACVILLSSKCSPIRDRICGLILLSM